MESRPVLFSNKTTLPKKLDNLADDGDDEPTAKKLDDLFRQSVPGGNNTIEPTEVNIDDEGESQNHTISTIVESDWVQFDGEQDHEDKTPKVQPGMINYNKDDIT